jgi:hypothetical protein
VTTPQPVGPRLTPQASLLVRLLAVAATVACLVAGFIIAFGNPTGNSFKDWIATGIISAGVALGCAIIL